MKLSTAAQSTDEYEGSPRSWRCLARVWCSMWCRAVANMSSLASVRLTRPKYFSRVLVVEAFTSRVSAAMPAM